MLFMGEKTDSDRDDFTLSAVRCQGVKRNGVKRNVKRKKDRRELPLYGHYLCLRPDAVDHLFQPRPVFDVILLHRHVVGSRLDEGAVSGQIKA